jgi:hypothetical protein
VAAQAVHPHPSTRSCSGSSIPGRRARTKSPSSSPPTRSWSASDS